MTAFFVLSAIVIWGMFASTGLWLLTFFPTLSKISPAGGLPVALTVLVLAGLVFTRTHYNVFTSTLYYTSYILFGLAFIAFCVTAAGAVLFILLKLCHVAARMYLGYASLGVMLILFACAFWGGFSAPALKKISVQGVNLPPLTIPTLAWGFRTPAGIKH